jgi:hypothetical protein
VIQTAPTHVGGYEIFENALALSQPKASIPMIFGKNGQNCHNFGEGRCRPTLNRYLLDERGRAEGQKVMFWAIAEPPDIKR